MSNATPITTIAPQVVEERKVASDLNEQYIAGVEGQAYFLGNIALPQTIDEAETLFGRGIYEQMSHDATLGPTTRLVVLRAFKGGLSVLPSHDAPPADAPDAEGQRKHETAVECADFVRYNLFRLRKLGEDIMSVLPTMTKEMIQGGHKLAEINTEIATDGPYVGERCLVSLKPKPRGNYAFVIKSFGGLQGVMAVIPGRYAAITQGILYDPAQVPNIVAPDKVLILKMGGLNGDPRGESCYREAYDPWLRYQKLKKQAMDVSFRFGDGIILAKIDKDAQADPQDVELKYLRGGGFYCPPKGVEVDIKYPQVDPKWFEFHFRQCQTEMAQAVIINARDVLSAQHGSEKDSGNAQDVVNEVAEGVGNIVETALENQLAYNLILWWKGKPIADEFTPKMMLGGTVSPDFAANAQGLGVLGYEFDESQYPALEKTFKIPARRPDWQKIRDEKAQSEADAAQNVSQAQETRFTPRRAGQPREQRAA